MISSEEDLRSFANIFFESSEIESMLEYVLDHLNIDYKPYSFQDKISKFCRYIDSRERGGKSTDKMFLNRYSLVDAFSGVKKYSDIARHEANHLLTGFSEIPIKVRSGKFRKQYIGDLNTLYLEFSKCSKALYPLYEMIQLEGDFKFELYDIDGSKLTKKVNND